MFRERYRVPLRQADAVPAELRERPMGADLASRVTALHKSSVLKDQVAGVDEPRSPAELLREQSRIRAGHPTVTSSGLLVGWCRRPVTMTGPRSSGLPSVPVRIVTETGRGAMMGARGKRLNVFQLE